MQNRTNPQKIFILFKEKMESYFNLFLEEYPTGVKALTQEVNAPVVAGKKLHFNFGSEKLNNMAIECQSLLVMLGPTAQKRLIKIGFEKLVPFDNDVEWYRWSQLIKDERVNPTIYVSIHFRINAEIQRMEHFLEQEMWGAYCQNLNDEYLVSFEKYDIWKPVEPLCDSNVVGQATNVVINNSYPQSSEKELYSNLGKIEKKTAIWANIATFLARVAGIKI